MITAAIIDDEPNNVELLSHIITTFAPQVSLVGTASGITDGFGLITNLKPALIFLDVEMKDGTGFDLLKLIPNIPVKVIFTTAHEKYAIDAFHVSAIDYLLKPISTAQLIAAIQKAETATSADELRLQLSVLLENINEPLTRNKKIILKTFERIYVTTSQDIIRFEADGNYTTVYLKDGTKIVVSKLLKDYEEILKDDSHFFRVHQSHLINLSYLHFFEKAENILIMKDKSTIPVAIRKRDQLLKLITV